MSDFPILKFNDDYFETEKRDGYVVERLTKHAWAAEMEVLAEIDSVCKRHGLRYFAEWGTMLGAVRHKGFIPWDDDLDIAMFRDDLMTFISVAPSELPAGSILLTPYNTKDSMSEVYRVSNSEWINIGEAFNEKYHKFPFAAGIDIFPYDFIPEDPRLQDSQIELLTAVLKAGMAWMRDDISLAEKRELTKKAGALTGIHFTEDDTIISQLARAQDAICALYKKGDSSLSGITYRMRYDRDREPKPAEWFDELIDMPFETITIPVPKEYDRILTKRYGDYMKPVLVPDHDYPFYASQIEVFNNYLKNNNMTYDPLYTKDRQTARLKEAMEKGLED